jgi:hypothetical protein
VARGKGPKSVDGNNAGLKGIWRKWSDEVDLVISMMISTLDCEEWSELRQNMTPSLGEAFSRSLEEFISV